MKSAILASSVVVSCALLASAAPASVVENGLFARGGAATKVAKAAKNPNVVKAAEKWALNPQGMMDRDQRKKNREDATKIATDAYKKSQGSSSQKRREFFDEHDLFARGGAASKVAKAAKNPNVAKAAEKWALNPQAMMDRDQRKKNREDATKIASDAYKKSRGSSSSSHQKREFLDEHSLFARGGAATKVAKAAKNPNIAKAAEKWALNPQAMMDRDQRKKNREDATKIASDAYKKSQNSSSSSNKRREFDEFESREFDDLEGREFDDFEDLFAREYYELDELE